MSVNIYQTTRRNIPEDSHLHTRRRENLKSHKVNVVPATKHNSMKAYEGAEVNINIFLIPALDGGECSASRSGSFSPEERATGAFEGLRENLGVTTKRKIPPFSGVGRPDIRFVSAQ
jgi:hypothetical protein